MDMCTLLIVGPTFKDNLAVGTHVRGRVFALTYHFHQDQYALGGQTPVVSEFVVEWVPPVATMLLSAHVDKESASGKHSTSMIDHRAESTCTRMLHDCLDSVLRCRHSRVRWLHASRAI